MPELLDYERPRRRQPKTIKWDRLTSLGIAGIWLMLLWVLLALWT